MSINLKIGILHLFKNGEIDFEQGNDDIDNGKRERRSLKRDDISVIDYASAILSQNGGK